MLDSRDQLLIARMTALCQETSAVILSYYNGDQTLLAIEQKSNNTPLTQADLAAHRKLVNGLPLITKIPVISEESPSETHLKRYHDYWLIDPIDGTREFIEHTDGFCIAIARIINHRPVFAYIYAPTSGEYWYAFHNKGAYKGDQDNTSIRLRCRDIADPVTIITARRKLSKRMQLYLEQNFANYKQIEAGSALKFCQIAEGKADIYPKISRTTSEWDTAAGDLILHEAGGGMRFANGLLPCYGNNDDTLNPPFIAYGAGLSESVISHYCTRIRELNNQN